jgi:DNA-directed RNA polymerase subunit RPC12/RpoP
MPNNEYILLSDALKAILGVSKYDTIEELEGARTIPENTWADGLYDAYKIIEEEVDAADVEPVRHGRWIDKSDDEYAYCENVYQCSVCGEEWDFLEGTPNQNSYHYCPNCGAKMEKEESENENHT